MNSRLKRIRTALGFNQTDFALKMGRNLRTVQRYESMGDIDDATINLICLTFNVNREWLLDGTGSMFNVDSDIKTDTLTDEQKAILFNYNSLTDADKKTIQALILSLLQKDLNVK